MAVADLRDNKLAIVLDGRITPGSPGVGEVGEAPVVEDNQEEAEDIDGKREQEGVEAQELSSEEANSQTEVRQTDMLVPLNA